MSGIMAGTALKSRKRRVFNSVFQPAVLPPPPTPEIEFLKPSEAFGEPHLSLRYGGSQDSNSDVRDFYSTPNTDGRDQALYDRCWHSITSFLSRLIDLVETEIDRRYSISDGISLPTPEPNVHHALKIIIEAETQLPLAIHKDDLIAWYAQQVRFNFLHTALPVLSRIDGIDGTEDILPNTVRVLQRAYHTYLQGLSLIIKQMKESELSTSKAVVKKFRQDLRAIVSNSVTERVFDSVRSFLARELVIMLQIPDSNGQYPTLGIEDCEVHRSQLLSFVESLYNVGLAGERFQIILAETMSKAMSSYVDNTFSGVWSFAQKGNPSQIDESSRNTPFTKHGNMPLSGASLLPRVANHAAPSRCVVQLCEWIENKYARLAVEILNKLDSVAVEWSDMEKWKEMSIGYLAALRTNELFDIVVSWPDSSGALDDLRVAVTTPQRRLHLTDVFSSHLKERLLHPGTSTLQILRTYISMIWSFHSLDQSKVLLDRVAYPLQLYLSSREDTVRIIITGLLSDTEDADGTPIQPGGEKLVELAILLNKGADNIGQRADEDLDWFDMDWQPDPVDAGPGYKRSKSVDVIGTLIGVLGSQDVFIKEFQNVVGENLLKHEDDFEKELKLLSLLKTRFGDAPLQSCEVMIRDILSSRPLNSIIRKQQKLDPSPEEIRAARIAPRSLRHNTINPEGLHKPSVNAKILSRLFWPQLHDETYRIPPLIANLLLRYEQGFQELKNARLLTWLPALGHATVELELLDRIVLEECQTWQATVIWAFESESDADKAVTRTVDELVENLAMDEALVRSALNFWVGKFVLHEEQSDVYSVLETLNNEDRARSNAQAAAAAAVAAIDANVDEGALASAARKDNGIGPEKGEMYWNFIQGMLKNSAAQMPVQQIGMMLKMLIADGFPYGDKELREFLEGKVEEGLLELKAGKYKLKK